MADSAPQKLAGLGVIGGDLPRNRSAGDFGASTSGDSTLQDNKVPSSHSLVGNPLLDGGINAPMGMSRQYGSHTSLQEGVPQRYEQASRSGDFGHPEGVNQGAGGSQPLYPAQNSDVLASAMGSLDINDTETRYGVSGLRRNPRSYANLSHGTGLHIDDGGSADILAPEIPPRTLKIHHVSPELSDEQLKADLQSYGDVQMLYTGMKPQGQVMVTFFNSHQAAQASALLNGRKVMNRQLVVESAQSQKDASATRVVLFNLGDNLSNDDIAREMSVFGPVIFVTKHKQVAGCREVYFADARDAGKAYTSIYPGSAGVHTINEDSEDGPQEGPVGLQSNVYRPPILNDQAQYSSRNWGEPELNRYGPQGVGGQGPIPGQGLSYQNMNSNPDLVALLNNAPPEALDQLLNKGYLTQQGSSSSLPSRIGQSGNFGSTSNLSSANFGSTSNLNAVGSTFGSSANLPAAANPGSSANLAGQAEFGSSANLGGSTNNLASLSGMSGSASHNNLASGLLQGGHDSLSQGLTHQQLAALRNGMLNVSPGALNKEKRSMTTPDLYSMDQANNLGGMGQPYGSGTYDPSELSGWGGATPTANNLDTAKLLYQTQALSNLGGMGMQRSVSALQLQQLNHQQQQQQQQLLLQLAMHNPQALQQLNNVRLHGAMPPSFNRGKAPRGDESLSGGRLSRRAADPAVEAERRAQQERHYALDAGKVERGEDPRTTLMIKNIPNKYTQKMLLQTIDEQFSRQYDFFYLPIDFKNKCNVGYAFINMVHPKYILPLMTRFNQKKWERFNSEKVCHISYARIQGKQQLVTHFQNSSLLHEDKRCRPILFKTDGDLAGEQEPFPSANTGARAHRARPANNEVNSEGSSQA